MAHNNHLQTLDKCDAWIEQLNSIQEEKAVGVHIDEEKEQMREHHRAGDIGRHVFIFRKQISVVHEDQTDSRNTYYEKKAEKNETHQL